MPRSSCDQPFRLGRKTVHGRFLIPSGIRCTHAATIRKCFLEVPSIGVVTTKSISARPRKGYREPIYARYAPGCYINAVGLANPGAEQFLAEFEGIEIPGDKFLLVSIFGSDVESFVEAARTLKPIADGFELNMSCPHAKGYGAEVGQDTELLRRITEAVVQIAEAPVFVKLSAMLPNLAGTATAAVAAGAAGITVTNTIGPALVAVGADPILHNKLGGLSGDGIRPLGLRAVEQVRQAVGEEPVIIGMGGIASAEHVRQYALAGADLFGIGSALTGLDSVQFREYLAQLQSDVCLDHGGQTCRRTCESPVPMDYVKARIGARVDYSGSLFKLVLESLPGDYRDGDLAGKFFFLCCPGVGEKPFAIFSASEKSVIVRTVGRVHAASCRPLRRAPRFCFGGRTGAVCRPLRTARWFTWAAARESPPCWRSRTGWDRATGRCSCWAREPASTFSTSRGSSDSGRFFSRPTMGAWGAAASFRSCSRKWSRESRPPRGSGSPSSTAARSRWSGSASRSSGKWYPRTASSEPSST